MKRPKETDLALKVVEWLTSQHWDVYQEVQICSSIADVVAVQGPLVWIIECKLSMSLGLIGQAHEWIRNAHFVSVAIPGGKRYLTKSRHVAKKIMRHYGIGMFEIYDLRDIREHSVQPRLNRKATTKIVKDSLREGHKHYAPAGSQGGYYTPFKATCRHMVRIVKKNPGIILKDLIDASRHHYLSDVTARACISKYAKRGIIKGIRCERSGKLLRFYPDDKEKGAAL